jgi:hypothetical protein
MQALLRRCKRSWEKLRGLLLPVAWRLVTRPVAGLWLGRVPVQRRSLVQDFPLEALQRWPGVDSQVVRQPFLIGPQRR